MATTWILIADARQAQIWTQQQNGPLRIIGTMSPGSNHRFSRDIASDKPGRSFSSLDARRSSIEPRHDLKQMEEEQFGIELVNMLQRSLDEKAFDTLLVVAPHRMLGTIRRHSSSNLRSRISADAAKELLKLPLGKIREEIRFLSSQEHLGNKA